MNSFLCAYTILKCGSTKSGGKDKVPCFCVVCILSELEDRPGNTGCNPSAQELEAGGV